MLMIKGRKMVTIRCRVRARVTSKLKGIVRVVVINRAHATLNLGSMEGIWLQSI